MKANTEKATKPDVQAKQQGDKDGGFVSWRFQEESRRCLDEFQMDDGQLIALPGSQGAGQRSPQFPEDENLGLVYHENSGFGSEFPWGKEGSWLKQSVQSAFWKRAMASSEVKLVDAAVTLGDTSSKTEIFAGWLVWKEIHWHGCNAVNARYEQKAPWNSEKLESTVCM